MHGGYDVHDVCDIRDERGRVYMMEMMYTTDMTYVMNMMYMTCTSAGRLVGSCSEAHYLKRNSAMDDSIGGS